LLTICPCVSRVCKAQCGGEGREGGREKRKKEEEGGKEKVRQRFSQAAVQSGSGLGFRV
jgi:hypothetical protein